MACFGSKAMQSRRPGTDNSMENPQMGGEGSGTMRDGKKKKNKNRRPAKEHHGTDAKRGSKGRSQGSFDKKGKKEEASLRNWDSSIQQNPVIRKQVDPETTKYFTEIANLLEGTEMDVEERSAICGNALEETRGKESEVATDYILSHTLQTLLEGCDVDSLCGFLQRCVDNFLYIAMDRSGSHVVETALKSLSLHGNEGFTFVDETLTKICQTALRLFVGEDQELMQIIRVLIGFHDENVEDQNLKAIVAQDMVKLLDDNAYSHLMEVSS
ncbi:hypothetical protein Scep_012038 [Stephania cephalantha]|uniref:Uncharacterized protein n=1 Tax=Stephania cephalantha TaxID=152367 RepID=A0AAP0JGE4_9MAGN